MKKLSVFLKNNFRTFSKKDSPLFLLLLSIFLLIPAGALHPDTKIEQVARTASKIVLENTEKKEYCSLVVSPKDSNYKLYDTNPEFYSLYGIFGEQNTNYVGAVNATKEHTIYINECNDNINLSFIYVESAGFSNVEYKGAWKHQYYPLQLMFQGKHYYSNVFSYCYISQSQAQKLLKNKNIPITPESYESLLGTAITLQMDDVDYQWNIANIYLETNEFYDDVSNVMGSFLLGYNKYPEGFHKEAVYFMRPQIFQNTYLLKHSVSLYSPLQYNYCFGTYNLLAKTSSAIEIQESALTTKAKFIYLFVFIPSILLFLFSMYKMIDGNFFDGFDRIIIFLSFLFVPHFLFLSMASFSNNAFLYSSFSAISYAVYVIGALLTYFSIYLYKKCKTVQRKQSD